MPKKTDTQAAIREAAALHALLANPVRLLVLLELAKGQRSVTALAAAVGHSRQGVSQHLQDMARAEVVTYQQDGTTRHYSLVWPLKGIVAATLTTLGVK